MLAADLDHRGERQITMGGLQPFALGLAHHERPARQDGRCPGGGVGRRVQRRLDHVDAVRRSDRRTERFGRQLIVQVRELEASREVPPPGPDVQAMVERNAELAADLEAARWTISSLEANVGGVPTGAQAVVARRDETPPAEPHPAPGANS